MILIGVGFVIRLTGVVMRAVLFQTRDFELGIKYRLLLVLCLVGDCLAFFGLRALASVPASVGIDYSTILVVLSLLAAGVIAGWFTFSYQNAAPDESILPNAISISFVSLFYLLFGAVAFYMGKSENIHSVEGITTIVPLIMTIILAANTLYDFWDYRELQE